MRLLSQITLLAIASGFSPIAEASGQIPAAMTNLPLLGEIPYTPGGSIGPIGPIVDLAADSDLRHFASEYWAVVDSGGTYTAPMAGFVWTAPSLVAMQTGTPATQPDPWGGGMVLFRHLYWHRLAPFTAGGPATIPELCETDPLIALLWKHWTLQRQLITASVLDPLAHDRHVQLAVDSILSLPNAKMRGVVHYDGIILITDRIEMLTVPAVPPGTVPPPPEPPPPPSNTSIAELQSLINVKKTKLTGFPGLYTRDIGYSAFGLLAGIPGFDCDDFADALAIFITKNTRAFRNTVFCWFRTANGWEQHLITRVGVGGVYWLIDAQTGKVAGPFTNATPMDASTVLSSTYGVIPFTTQTSQTLHEIGDRSSFQGGYSGEPEPWTSSPTMVSHFESTTGFSASDFTLP